MSGEINKWYIEHTAPGIANMFGVDSFTASVRTRYQQVEIAETELFGRLLLIDGKIQSAERDEYIYHEALVHPAMLACPAPRRVLVIGGGEGATLREALKHPTVEKLVMVDLDREVVELCRKHLESWHRGSYDDKRVELVFMDARKFLEESDEIFDVIISDVTDPVAHGTSLQLYTRQYYKLVAGRLAEEGCFCLQAGDYGLPTIDAYSAIFHTVSTVMDYTLSYRAFIPSFKTEWGFILAANRKMDLPVGEELDRIISTRGLELKYFGGETAQSIFAVPRDIRARLAAETRIIDDDNLLTIY